MSTACSSEYAECPEGDRRCVRGGADGHADGLHYNRAGFGWDDDEAAESARRKLVEALRQAGARVEEGRAWYRTLDPNGELWCETSSLREAVDSIEGQEGYTFQRLPVYIIRMPWEPWTPPSGATQ